MIASVPILTLGAVAAPTTSWQALPNQGLNTSVYTLAVVERDLYAAGPFHQTGDGTVINLGSIARYSPTDDAWQALSNRGLNNSVYALAVVGNDLYVGGSFTQTGDGTVTNLGGIARYDISSGTWHALNNQGLDGTVHALAVSGNDLYVGGAFAQTGDGSLTNLGGIARYDTTAPGTWHALNNGGVDDTVLTMVVDGINLYVGGKFTQTGDGTVTNLGCIAHYDTTAPGTWQALPNQGLNSWVEALAVVDSDLYVGGLFSQTADSTLGLGHIARYDTAAGTWQAMSNQGLSGYVFMIRLVGSDLYVGGSFTQTDDGALALNHVARYGLASGTWQALPNQGLDSTVRVLAVSGKALYMAGQFAQTGDGSLTNLGHVVRYERYYFVYLPLVTR